VSQLYFVRPGSTLCLLVGQSAYCYSIGYYCKDLRPDTGILYYSKRGARLSR
jgi:hypothetical protein